MPQQAAVVVVLILPETGTGTGTDPWASFTWEERVQASIDRASAADEARRANGGDIGASGTFEWEDGTEGTIAEAHPYRIPMLSIPAEYLEVPEDIAALPDIIGTGNMHDLQQALVRDSS